jgi:peroxiredoxin
VENFPTKEIPLGHVERALLIAMISMLSFWGCATTPDSTGAPPAALTLKPTSVLVLPAPADRGEQAYLGLDTTGDFALRDIKAQVVLIEVFDMYCPHCRHEAPNVNRLYRRIADDPDLAGRIKLIGIGVGNTAYEVNLFRKTFNVEFPLFTDRSRQLARQLEVRQTPTFIGFTRLEDGTLQRVLFVPGAFGNVEDFLDRLREAARPENRPV